MNVTVVPVISISLNKILNETTAVDPYLLSGFGNIKLLKWLQVTNAVAGQ